MIILFDCQVNNLPTCIALAELKIESQNFDRAQFLLNQGLAWSQPIA